jgi:hypothetical protein
MVKRKNSNKVMRGGGENNDTEFKMFLGAVFLVIVAVIMMLAATNVF